MGGKHLKKLRAEKSKVKLKQKKILPKGQNITDTSFKVKKIVTIEQFKKIDENEPVSSWNVPLKDLLVRLNHYNFTSRLNSLNGIKELVTNYPSILTGPSLRPTIVRILELLSDPEHKIRTTAIKLIEFFFSQLSSNSIAPFCDIVAVHLSCAMTHRDISIQKDSIKFIDVLINYTPETIKKNFNNLVKNFVRIVKIYFYGSGPHIEVSKGSKTSLERARTEIFLRFYHVLAVAYSVPQEKAINSKAIIVSSSQQRVSLRGLTNEYKKIPDLSALFQNSKHEENFLPKSDLLELKDKCSIIVPLLFDTWSEFGPNHQTDGFVNESILNESVADLLHVLLRILLLLYEKIKTLQDPDLEFWFVSTYGPSFQKSFTNNFPYMPTVSYKKSTMGTHGDSPSTDLNLYLMQNLIICYLFYGFNFKQKNHGYESKVERYIASALLVKNHQGIEILGKVIECVINSPKNKKSDIIITPIVKAYNATSNYELRKILFKILMKVTVDENFSVYQNNLSLHRWMKTLPERLLKPRVPSYVIETLLKIINRPAGLEVLKLVEAKAVSIVENLPNMKIEGMDQLEGQKLIADVLYWCSNSVIEEIVKRRVLQNDYPQELSSYIIEIFSYKLTNQSS